MGDIELYMTEDGSYTLFNSEKKEHYHSVHGAVQESRHVFIQAGLSEISAVKENLRILEVGFGTGLNAFLTLLEKEKLKESRNLKIDYVGLEPYLIPQNMILQLKYAEYLEAVNLHEHFMNMHMNIGIRQVLDEKFTFTLIKERLEDYNPSDHFDLIYFDAFSPNTEAGIMGYR